MRSGQVMDAVGLHGPSAARRAGAWVDVCVFVLLHLQAAAVDLPSYNQAVRCGRQRRRAATTRRGEAAASWTTQTLTRCLAELNRRARRHARIQRTRAKVERLAREVHNLEQGIKPEPTASSGGYRRAGGSSGMHESLGPYTREGLGSERAEQAIPEHPNPPVVTKAVVEATDLEGVAWREAVTRGQQVATAAAALVHMADEGGGATFNWVRPWLVRGWPWLSAPDGSGCYALYTAAYVTSLDPLLLPLMLAVFGYALLAVPKAPPRFWRGALLYTEGCLVVLYLLAVPCYWGCWGARVCGRCVVEFRANPYLITQASPVEQKRG